MIDQKITLDFHLEQTCMACPEQYDVYFEGKLVGYLRLRHGHFRAEYFDGNDYTDIVYSDYPRGDGIFYDNERDFYLKNACKAILKRHWAS